MASTYSSNLKLELIADGEKAGLWGQITNLNLGTAIEEAIVGIATVSFGSDADLTLTLTTANTSQAARNAALNVVSGVALTATRNLIVPAIRKPYVVANLTTGGQSIIVKTAAGTGVTIPNGQTTWLYVDGTNVIQSFTYLPTLRAGAINNTPIGATTPSTGAFTTLSASGALSSAGYSGTTGSFSGTLSSAGYTGTTGSFTGTLSSAGYSGTTGTFSGTLSSSGYTGTTGSFTGTLSSVGYSGSAGTFSGNLTVQGIGDFTATSYLSIPSGTTAQRGTPSRPSIRYNATLTSFEGFNGTTWGSIGGGATGGGADRVFNLNSNVVTQNFTIPAGQNANSTGPLTINDGVTVTVPDGSNWVIL